MTGLLMLVALSLMNFGVKGGVNAANLMIDGDVVPPVLNNYIGRVAGTFVAWEVTPHLDIQCETLFSRKGASFDESGVDADMRISYLEIPILFRYGSPVEAGKLRYGRAVKVFAGPSFAFKRNAEATGEFPGVSDGQDIDDAIAAFDFGFVIGAGIESRGIVFDGRYTRGLRNVNAQPRQDDANFKHRVFSIMVGFRL